jgi:hypothetical protein
MVERVAYSYISFVGTSNSEINYARQHLESWNLLLCPLEGISIEDLFCPSDSQIKVREISLRLVSLSDACVFERMSSLICWAMLEKAAITCGRKVGVQGERRKYFANFMMAKVYGTPIPERSICAGGPDRVPEYESCAVPDRAHLFCHCFILHSMGNVRDGHALLVINFLIQPRVPKLLRSASGMPTKVLRAQRARPRYFPVALHGAYYRAYKPIHRSMKPLNQSFAAPASSLLCVDPSKFDFRPHLTA